jgi:hypothetical protein
VKRPVHEAPVVQRGSSGRDLLLAATGGQDVQTFPVARAAQRNQPVALVGPAVLKG